jgi:hypothetical protein
MTQSMLGVATGRYVESLLYEVTATDRRRWRIRVDPIAMLRME